MPVNKTELYIGIAGLGVSILGLVLYKHSQAANDSQAALLAQQQAQQNAIDAQLLESQQSYGSSDVSGSSGNAPVSSSFDATAGGLLSSSANTTAVPGTTNGGSTDSDTNQLLAAIAALLISEAPSGTTSTPTSKSGVTVPAGTLIGVHSDPQAPVLAASSTAPVALQPSGTPVDTQPLTLGSGTVLTSKTPSKPLLPTPFKGLRG